MARRNVRSRCGAWLSFLRTLLIELCEAKAEFLLVGGWAVILYGHVRATDDMDVFVRPTPVNSQRVFAALEALGAPLHAHAVTGGRFASEGPAYRFGIAPFKIKVLTTISGVSFDEALRGSKTFEINGYRIPYIGKSALIANKKLAGRHKDLADVDELERLDDR
jgi:predicted nucleotidyltransferase